MTASERSILSRRLKTIYSIPLQLVQLSRRQVSRAVCVDSRDMPRRHWCSRHQPPLRERLLISSSVGGRRQNFCGNRQTTTWCWMRRSTSRLGQATVPATKLWILDGPSPGETVQIARSAPSATTAWPKCPRYRPIKRLARHKGRLVPLG